jgi:hypothetical protein
VSIKLTPEEAQFGQRTEISGTVLRDGAPLAVTATLALVGLWRTRGRPTSPRP